jgi:hypothetical protein
MLTRFLRGVASNVWLQVLCAVLLVLPYVYVLLVQARIHKLSATRSPNEEGDLGYGRLQSPPREGSLP